jgi:hypothetical protein
MITNEQHERFLSKIDEQIKNLKEQNHFTNSKSNIEFCLERFCQIKYGKVLPIVFVSNPNKYSNVTEYYSSEMNLPWLVSYVFYYTEFLTLNKLKSLEGFSVLSIEEMSEDYYKIYTQCLFMSIIMTMCRGVALKDDVIYVLTKDVDFVNYKIEPKLFI